MEAADERAPRGNSTFGALFRRPGVVYPIHPAGHLRLPRPKLPFKREGQLRGGDGGAREEGLVTFVVQVIILLGEGWGWVEKKTGSPCRANCTIYHRLDHGLKYGKERGGGHLSQTLRVERYLNIPLRDRSAYPGVSLVPPGDTSNYVPESGVFLRHPLYN